MGSTDSRPHREPPSVPTAAQMGVPLHLRMPALILVLIFIGWLRSRRVEWEARTCVRTVNHERTKYGSDGGDGGAGARAGLGLGLDLHGWLRSRRVEWEARTCVRTV